MIEDYIGDALIWLVKVRAKSNRTFKTLDLVTVFGFQSLKIEVSATNDLLFVTKHRYLGFVLIELNTIFDISTQIAKLTSIPAHDSSMQ